MTTTTVSTDAEVLALYDLGRARRHLRTFQKYRDELDVAFRGVPMNKFDKDDLVLMAFSLSLGCGSLEPTGDKGFNFFD